ncbi:MAG: hypothetical protein CENE_01407 [Candidatus Celerinatantimonas neptuna]|nr:MAG: hypothetical protein CENE_01407 [Candidatus Celerinatantimonas neptuna]
MKINVLYLFDPLCGWCYGASPAVSALSDQDDICLEMVPVGLFLDDGARKIDAYFVHYIEQSDQRIAQMSGQLFSDAYRQNILHGSYRFIDSGPATLALSAVSLCCATRELDVLKAIQNTRYVEGQDITAMPVLVGLLNQLGLNEAAALLEARGDELRQYSDQRVERGQKLLHQLQVQGVPTFAVVQEQEYRLLSSSKAFGHINELIQSIRNA